MADVVAPTPVAAEPAAAPAAAPAERGRALIEKHVRAAQEAQVKELAETPLERSDPPSELRTTPPKDPKTGKFLKSGEKPAAEPAKPEDAAAAKPAPAAAPAKEPDAVGGIGKARRLVAEGKLEQAMELIGLKPDQIPHGAWKNWRLNNEKVVAAIQGERQQIDQGRAELDRISRLLTAEYEPYANAKKAYASGDYEEAFKLAFGEDLNGFQRKALQRMANPGVGKDPAVVALQTELSKLRQERDEERKQLETQRAEQSAREQQQRYWSDMTSALEGAEDPRITAAASKPAFKQKIHQIQRKYYDPNTDSTMPTLEAAELALEELQSELNEWGGIFGGGKPAAEAARTRAASTPATTDQGRIPARRPARAATSLSTSEAAEAAPAQKLRGKALLDKFVREAQAQAAREAG